ncbi:conserved hypothetical protein [Bradyrhizobium sp. ORS 375]|nr:conserved hypothetical protein [Bradyrhizobium sp. ORS 375]
MSWLRRHLRSAFGPFTSEEALRTLEQNEVPAPTLESARLCYVLLHVRDDAEGIISGNVADATELLIREGAIIDSVLSSLISAVIPMDPATKLDVVERHLGRLGPNVRAVYRIGEYPRGPFGSPLRMTYGTVVSDLGAALERLLHLEFGTAERLGIAEAT